MSDTQRPIPAGWHVVYAPLLIPTRECDWHYWHDRYEAGEPYHGYAPSYDGALDQIERLIAAGLSE